MHAQRWQYQQTREIERSERSRMQTGLGRGVRSPSPNCPFSFLPHAQTAPDPMWQAPSVQRSVHSTEEEEGLDTCNNHGSGEACRHPFGCNPLVEGNRYNLLAGRLNLKRGSTPEVRARQLRGECWRGSHLHDLGERQSHPR